MLKLHNLTSITKKRKRRGRGGSRGGTSGRGNKGQKARSGGGTTSIFEGGQMPYVRRLPKRGFNNTRFAQEIKIVNIERLEEVFEAGAVVDTAALQERGILKGKSRYILKILGTGQLTKKLTVIAHLFSKSAIESIERQGGKAQLIKE